MFVAKLMQILPAAAQLVAHLTAMEDAPIPTATECLTFSATYVLHSYFSDLMPLSQAGQKIGLMIAILAIIVIEQAIHKRSSCYKGRGRSIRVGIVDWIMLGYL